MPPILKLEAGTILVGLVMVSDKREFVDGMWLVTLFSSAGEIRLVVTKHDADAFELGKKYSHCIFKEAE